VLGREDVTQIKGRETGRKSVEKHEQGKSGRRSPLCLRGEGILAKRRVPVKSRGTNLFSRKNDEAPYLGRRPRRQATEEHTGDEYQNRSPRSLAKEKDSKKSGYDERQIMNSNNEAVRKQRNGASKNDPLKGEKLYSTEIRRSGPCKKGRN